MNQHDEIKYNTSSTDELMKIIRFTFKKKPEVATIWAIIIKTRTLACSNEHFCILKNYRTPFFFNPIFYERGVFSQLHGHNIKNNSAPPRSVYSVWNIAALCFSVLRLK